MNPDKPGEIDENLTSLLATGDDSLARGKTPTELVASAPLGELGHDLAFLHTLRQVLRRPASAGTGRECDPPDRPWTHLGRFAIRRELGRGGFGVVYLAHDPVLNREVALKVPREDVLAAPEWRERFRREAQAAAGLEHPNIVPVYEAGADGALCFLVSAYCPGFTLARWLRERTEAVAYADAAALLAALADAAQHAHDRGVVHRDLKPANILLVRGDRGPMGPIGPIGPLSPGATYQPKITDFGLAKLLHVAPAEAVPTRTGAIVGTAAYMAPEQAAAGKEEVGPAADLYALGAILYELLTGRPPFQGDSDLEILLRARAEEPLPPRRLRPSVPRDLEVICLKCLRKEPARRYASARELADDLRRFLEGKPILARPAGGAERLWRWCRRNAWVAGLTAAVAALLVTGTAGATLAAFQQYRLTKAADQARQEAVDWARREETARTAAEENLQKARAAEARARHEVAKAAAITQFLVSDILAQAAPLRNPASQPVTVREALDRAAARVDKAFAGQPELEAAVRRWIGDIYYRLGQYPEAEEHLQKALELSRRALGADHPETVLAMYNYADLLRSQGKPAEAEPLCRQTVEASRRVLGPEHLNTLNALNLLGTVLHARRKLTEAEPLLRQTLEAGRRTHGPQHPLTVSALNNLAVLLLDQGNLTEAEPLFRQTLEARRRGRGDEHPFTLTSMLNLASLLQQQGNRAEAETLFREALRLQRKVLPAGHPDVTLGLLGLGMILPKHRTQEAEPLLREALEIRRTALPKGHWLTAQAESVLGSRLTLLGRYEEAEPLLLGGYETLSTVQGAPPREMSLALRRLVTLYEAWGQPEKAAAWAAKKSALTQPEKK